MSNIRDKIDKIDIDRYIEISNSMWERKRYAEKPSGIIGQQLGRQGIMYNKNDYSDQMKFVDKLTTTNSTGILQVRDTERLRVIDCVEFFEECLNNN